LAGLVVVLMQSGGELLEEYAQGRASRAVRDLEAAAPRLAHRFGEAGVEDVPVETIAAGDRLLVRPGEMIPCDAEVLEGTSHLDTASISGEPIPRKVGPLAHILSGSYNQEAPLVLRASAPAAESQYARIVELVRSAQASQAPLQRMADRYAVWFTPLTLVVAAAAYAASGDSLRVLSVLVVATPCPLILAAPVAIIGGINRAARRRIVMRNGTALEQIGQVEAAVFDKTGTLTIGRPRVARVVVADPFTRERVLRLAGAVEHNSSHLLARSLVEEAERGGTPVPSAPEAIEHPGRGIRGQVDGHVVVVGARSYLAELAPEADFSAIAPGDVGLAAWVAIDGRAAAIVEYEDAIREEAPEVLAALGRLGLWHTILLSGDATANVEAVARSLGIADYRGDLLAEDKVAVVRRLRAEGHRVVMMGDGTNDAPALSAATVGVAIASREAAISAEAADIVLLADDLRLLPAAIEISRRTLRIARESIWAGLGLSGIAMLFAAAGAIPPTVGAVIQELIDVAVIVHALRSGREPAGSAVPVPPATGAPIGGPEPAVSRGSA
ncbi:MAG TPA: heavy metal translocating P-type ATPase, partial [Gemmatimonadales bacterium]|nr:heavy metal translocating P-type ATPase [Gemmatimonadales bacterium]